MPRLAKKAVGDMRDLFYTEEQRGRLKEMAEDSSARHRPLSEATGAAILDALGEQQNTMLIILDEIRKLNTGEMQEKEVSGGRVRMEDFVRTLPGETIEEIEKALRLIWK